MQLRDLYDRHPTLAFTVQTVTACALGYITHIVQQRWSHENYLLLHISIWWIAIVLLLMYFAERKVTPDQRVAEKWSKHFRLNVLFKGDEAWFYDRQSEELNEDLPTAGPLFRSLCLRMPARWQLRFMKASLVEQCHTAAFGDKKSTVIEIDFGPWEVGWRVSLTKIENTSHEQVRDFLIDLQRTIESTDGVANALWYHDDMLQGGQMPKEDYALGTPTPIEKLTNGK